MIGLQDVLYLWAGGGLTAAAGYGLGYVKGKETGSAQERKFHEEIASTKAQRAWEAERVALRVAALARQKPHGDPDHLCDRECYQFARR